MTEKEQLLSSFSEGKFDLAMELLVRNPSLSASKNDRDQTVLWLAVYNGHIDAVQFILNNSSVEADTITKPDDLGRTPLSIARDFDDHDMVDLLKPFFGYAETRSAQSASSPSSIFSTLRDFGLYLEGLAMNLNTPRKLALASAAVALTTGAVLGANLFNSRNSDDVENWMASTEFNYPALEQTVRKRLANRSFRGLPSASGEISLNGLTVRATTSSILAASNDQDSSELTNSDTLSSCDITASRDSLEMRRRIEVRIRDREIVAISTNLLEFDPGFGADKEAILNWSLYICYNEN